MKSYRLGVRRSNPAFFDMACRFKPANARWYGSGFRLGDRAGAVVAMGHWRAHNPTRKLIILEDNFLPCCEHSKRLEARWLFQGIADEVFTTTAPHEHIERPAAENLYYERLWRSWWRIMHTKRVFFPALASEAPSRDIVNQLIVRLGIPPTYVTLQPLWDAKYDRYRNQSPIWWERLIQRLVSFMPVVVLGATTNACKLSLPPGAFPVWDHRIDAMASLEFMRRAAWHVGGETGLTLWAPMLNVPTAALYRTWQRRADHLETRPMTFGKPVVWVPLVENVDVVADLIVKAYTDPKTVNTPV